MIDINAHSKKMFDDSVTVGIPYYEGTKLSQLRLAIDSILGQTHMPDDIHLIQDGPVSKELEELVDYYVSRYNIISKIVIEENRGLAYVLNISILNSKNKYYARMDSDDICHPDRIRKQLEYMKSHPDICILGTWISEFYNDSIFNEALDYKKADKHSYVVKTPENLDDIRQKFHYRNPICHVTVMFRRDVFAIIGLYNADYRRTQDLELWSRALKKDVGIANLQEPLVYVRAKDFAKKRSDIGSIIRQAKVRYKYNTLSPKYNLLKIASICFRVLPYKLRKWAYTKLR